MSIIFRLDRVMADRKMPLNELAKRIDLTDSNLSILKTGKAKAIRIATLEALCRELRCQPGDLLEYSPDEPQEWNPGTSGSYVKSSGL